MSLWPTKLHVGNHRPVTPAMHKGWAPITEKINDAMKEESKTSETPYCSVDSIKCRENAIPGSTLTKWSVNESVQGPTGRADCVRCQVSKKKKGKRKENFIKKRNTLRKEEEGVIGED